MNDGSMSSRKRITGNQSGFSLAETLVALLVLTLVSVMMVNGIRLAVREQRKITDKANAQILLSTTVTELRSRLMNAYDISVSEGENEISFSDWSTKNRLIIVSEPDGIRISYGDEKKLLVTSEAASKDMHVECSFAYDGSGLISIKEIKVKKEGNVLAELEEFLIRI